MSSAENAPSANTGQDDGRVASGCFDRKPVDGTAVLRGFLEKEKGLPPEKQPFTEWMRNILNGSDPIANARTAASEAEKKRLFDTATNKDKDRMQASLENERVSEENETLAEVQRTARAQRSIQDEQHRHSLKIMQEAFKDFAPAPYGKGKAIELVADTWNKMTPAERHHLIVQSNPYSSFMFTGSVDTDAIWTDPASGLLGEYILTKILGSHDLSFLPPKEDIPVVKRIDTAVKTENKIPPDVMQQWRKCGPEIVLEENESIYDPDTVQKIRNSLKDKRVLMLDQDGVITPTELMNDSVIKPSDDVIEAIKKLHEQGYTLMYWTSRKNDTGDVYEMLLKADLASLFTVVICRENTRLEKREERAHAVQMIDSSDWLDDTTRMKLTTCIEKGGKENFGLRLVPKLPHCLVTTCAMIDDHPWWDEEYFPERKTDTAYAEAYPAFVPPTLFDPRNPHYAPEADEPMSDYFGTNWIQRINDAYPAPEKTPLE